MGGLRGGDRPGEHELGRVVDDVTGAPCPATRGLELEEVHLPDAVAARGQLDERRASRASEVAALADVVDREGQAGLTEDPQARRVGDVQAVLVAGQPGDLAMSPHRVLQRQLDDDGADPVPGRRRPRTANLMAGVVAGTVVVVGAGGQPDGPAERGDRQAVLDPERVELSQTPSPTGRHA